MEIDTEKGTNLQHRFGNSGAELQSVVYLIYFWELQTGFLMFFHSFPIFAIFLDIRGNIFMFVQEA